MEKRKQAFVAGGSGAIGGAICRTLAREGFDVAFTWHRNRQAADTLATELQTICRTTMHQLDLTDPSALAQAISGTEALDAVVYAAGPAVRMRFTQDIDSAEFAKELGTDAVGCFNLVREALPRLRAAKGALVGVLTMAIARTISRDLLSAAPKAAVEQIFRTVALEYGRFGVRSNCVAPGLIDGGLIHQLLASGDYTQATVDATIKSTPLRSAGTPADVAEAVVFLASEKARWITGQTLFVDGGFSR